MNRKNIDVKNQVTLSFEKSFKFCRKGISYRLFRSSLTLAVVVVAVAFFTVLLTESIIVRATAIGVSEEMATAREADTLLMHLFHRYSSRDLSAKIAGMRGKPERIAEFAQVAGISEAEANALMKQCRLEQVFLNFFANLSAGKRVVLVKKNTGRDIFGYLYGKDAWAEFEVALAKMRSVRLPEGVDTLRAFLDGRDAFLKDLDNARSGREAKVTDMEKAQKVLTDGMNPSEWIAQASDSDVEKWREIVEKHGFRLDAEKMARVREIMKLSAIEGRISRLLQTPEKRQKWKEEMQTTPGLEEKFLMLKEEKVGELLDGEFSVEERAAVSGRFIRMRHLRDLVLKLPAVHDATVSNQGFLDGRQMFLVIISFVVCMVGITNAMLMSITERFREIATMKCLGATDGFILKQFLIEAAIQGVVGGTAGMAIGMVITVIKSALMLGSMAFVHFPGLQVFYCGVSTVVVGILLAMMASIYPSRAAASMAPMDAMRVE